jgi:hypothetical protein
MRGARSPRAASSAEDARECCRNGIRQDSPCFESRNSGYACQQFPIAISHRSDHSHPGVGRDRWHGRLAVDRSRGSHGAGHQSDTKRVDLRVTGNGSRPDQLNECPAVSVNGAGWRGPGYIPWLRPDRPAMSLFDERVRAPAAPLARPAARLVEAATSKHRHHIFRLGSRRMLACLVR